MSHVDALSRVVALIDSLPLEMEVEMEFCQLKDLIYKSIAADLEENP